MDRLGQVSTARTVNPPVGLNLGPSERVPYYNPVSSTVTYPDGEVIYYPWLLRIGLSAAKIPSDLRMRRMQTLSGLLLMFATSWILMEDSIGVSCSIIVAFGIAVVLGAASARLLGFRVANRQLSVSQFDDIAIAWRKPCYWWQATGLFLMMIAIFLRAPAGIDTSTSGRIGSILIALCIVSHVFRTIAAERRLRSGTSSIYRISN